MKIFYNNRSLSGNPVLKMALPFLLFVSCGAVDPARRYPNMVADMNPVSVGTIEAEFDRMFSSKLRKSAINVIFYPRENTVALEFKYEFVTYRQFWDPAGRLQFAGALEQYKADYAAHNLIDKYGKTRAAYGKTKGKVEWETFKFTTTYRSFPVLETGYRFRMKAPYFSVLQHSAPDESGMGGDRGKLESLQINLYFTRAQAEELVRIFDQEHLLSFVDIAPAPEAAEDLEEDYNEEPVY
jgi:hypothetical protein